MKKKGIISAWMAIYVMTFAGIFMLESFILLGDASNAFYSPTPAQASASVAPTDCIISSFALPAQGVNITEVAGGSSGPSFLQRSYSRLRAQSNKEFWRVFRGRAQLKDIFDNALLFFKGGFPSLNVEYSTIVFYLRRLRL